MSLPLVAGEASAKGLLRGQITDAATKETLGFASVVLSAFARISSTHDAMKQKNAATPTPGATTGKSTTKKNEAAPRPSTREVSSSSTGIWRINPSRIQTATGTVNRQCASATPR